MNSEYRTVSLVSFFFASQFAVSVVGFTFYLNPLNEPNDSNDISKSRVKVLKIALNVFSIICSACFASLPTSGDCKSTAFAAQITFHFMQITITILLLSRLQTIIVQVSKSSFEKTIHNFICLVIILNRVIASLYDLIGYYAVIQPNGLCFPQGAFPAQAYFTVSDRVVDFYVCIAISTKLLSHSLNTTKQDHSLTYKVFSISILIRTIIVTSFAVLPVLFNGMSSMIYMGAALCIQVYLITFEEAFYQNCVKLFNAIASNDELKAPKIQNGNFPRQADIKLESRPNDRSIVIEKALLKPAQAKRNDVLDRTMEHGRATPFPGHRNESLDEIMESVGHELRRENSSDVYNSRMQYHGDSDRRMTASPFQADERPVIPVRSHTPTGARPKTPTGPLRAPTPSRSPPKMFY